MAFQVFEAFLTGSGALGRLGSGQRRFFAEVKRKWVTVYDPHLGVKASIHVKKWKELQARERENHEVGWSALCEVIGNHGKSRPLTRLEVELERWVCHKGRAISQEQR